MTDTRPSELPYRPCVGVMLLNRNGLIFAGRRIDSTAEAWQMPQGGVDPGEAPRAAALRELREETGVRADYVTVLRESSDWIPYDLPPELQGVLWGGRFRGQTQKWFALRLDAGDEAIDIATAEPEFKSWAWMDAAELMASIVPFKRAVYDAVFREFSDLIGPRA